MENKNEIENQVNHIKETTSSVQEHLKSFDDFFEEEVSKRTNKNVLETLFNDFIDLAYKHTTLYKYMLNKIATIDEELILLLNPKQKELFDAYEYLTTKMSDDFGLQSFIYRLCFRSADTNR